MPQYSFLGDIVARDDWVAIQEQLADALRMEVHTLGPDGADLCPPSRVSRFRELLNRTSAARSQIPDGRLDVVQRTGQRGELLVESTSTGRMRFAVPILFRGVHLATVSGGGRLAEPMPYQRIVELSKLSGVPEAELASAASELELADLDTMYAAGQLIASLLQQLVVAVEHRLTAELQVRRVEALARVGQLVTESLDMDRVLEAIMDAIPQVMEAKACLVALVDDDGVLRTRAYRGLPASYAALEFMPGQGLSGAVVSTGHPVNVPDMDRDSRSVYRQHDADAGLRALVAVPLRDGEAAIGVISAFHGEPDHFSEDDETLLLNFADYASAAVVGARLYGRMRQAYRELGMATRRLNQVQEQMLHTDRLAEVGRLAGGAAHEMKNTLGGIIGAASTVRDHLDKMSNEDVRELVAAIAEEGWRLRNTIEDVRGFAKPRHLGRGRHKLAPVLDETLRLLSFDPQFQHLPLTCQVDEALEFQGDRDRLKQVLLNLLRNASDAVKGVAAAQPAVRVEAEATDDGVVIRVIDNGVGIPPENLERIWEPFYTTKGAAGTGLGLDLVRQIIRDQGGEIGVASQLGAGTTFTVHLPGGRPLAAAGEAA